MVRWKQQAMKIMAGSVLATAAVTGCSGGVSERIKEVVGEAAGEFRGDRPRTVLVIQTGGAASPARLLADAEPVLAETAREGGAVRVLVLSSGSAASMTEVRLPRGGDFTPVGRNQAAWTKEAQDYADAADREVDAALQRRSPPRATRCRCLAVRSTPWTPPCRRTRRRPRLPTPSRRLRHRWTARPRRPTRTD